MEPTKRILTEEVRKQLIGFLPFSIDCTCKFTPELFQKSKVPVEFQPVFDVRPYTKAEKTQRQKNWSDYYKDKTPEKLSLVIDQNTKILTDCINGWATLFDTGNLNEIEYKAKLGQGIGCDLETFYKLPEWLQTSIGNFVQKISGLSSEEELSLK